MTAKTIHGKSPSELKISLKKCIDNNFFPSLAILFISVKQDINSVIEILSAQNIDIIGATSCTEFVEGYQTDGGYAIMLLEISNTDYCLLFEEVGNSTLIEASLRITQSAFQKFSQPSFILLITSINRLGEMLDGETIVKNIVDETESKTNLFGGMAGDDFTFIGTSVFTHNQKTDEGIAALVIDESKIEMYGVALSGWKAIGISKTMTKCDGNLLFEIDGQPALEMYLRFLGHDFTTLEDRMKFFDSLGLHYPLQIERVGREPMMCSPIGYNSTKGALMLESVIEQGTKFRFSTPPDFDIVETVVNKAKEIKNKVNTDADALLIFSCASRLSALGPMAEQENNELASVWNCPMAGFYTYGEFGRAIDGKHEFHSTTCSWVALKEKN
ncbi:MAG: hypothetical protein E6Q58_04115 [Niabella sp.]|nr:MAG: hypothetical protein E6Q58_04115 [Niabella sp.]